LNNEEALQVRTGCKQLYFILQVTQEFVSILQVTPKSVSILQVMHTNVEWKARRMKSLSW